jgi:ABC-type uncharacterized transport system permease subunit
MKNTAVKNTVLGFLVGITLALSLTFLAGENPLHVALILFKSAFGSNYDFGTTLSYVAPFIFSGLSVAVAFHAGLFNIGAEGQLTMAAILTTWLGIHCVNLPYPLGPVILVIASMFFGAAWGFIPGWLKARRGSHEVIITIMLNFIAAGFSSWVALNVIPRPDSQNPESAFIAEAASLKRVDFIAAAFPNTPVNLSLLFAVIACFAVWIFLWKTPWGYELRATGANPEAANRAGISRPHYQILAMSLAGALAGLVAVSEIVAGPGNFRLGFSPDYGFMGIAVALLARNHPLGILFSAFLLGALHKGASDLDLETQTITRDFSKIVQALIVICVAIPWIHENFRRPSKNSPKKHAEKGKSDAP